MALHLTQLLPDLEGGPASLLSYTCPHRSRYKIHKDLQINFAGFYACK